MPTRRELLTVVSLAAGGSVSVPASGVAQGRFVGPQDALVANLGAPIVQTLEAGTWGLLVLTEQELLLLDIREGHWARGSVVDLPVVPERLMVWRGWVWGIRGESLFRVFDLDLGG